MRYLAQAEYEADPVSVVDRAVRFNEIIGLRGTEGNAVLMSQDEYDAMMETVHLCRDPRNRDEILEAANEMLEDCIVEEDADW